ncbi:MULTISPECIES: hypothetical protein [Salinimonas]|uniref:Uncharacterized protein n=2 Tax=Salinimonas TaxID=288793 RepID=A0A5B7YJM7_9ALTE|nr:MULTISPECIES: hypothetical protein [Salinimonas]MBD3587579.1 hypothetical protein [Salinimonas profundi]QCZ95503.1 hypothetical protein FBQ74_18455 [Salinimonas iocasae]
MTVSSKTMKRVTSSVLLFMFTTVAQANNDCDIGCMGDNASAGGLGVWKAIQIALLIIGILTAAAGIIGLVQGRNGQESSGSHWRKIGGGGLLAGTFGIILAVNSQFFGSSEEVRQTKTLIEQSR